MVHPDSPEELRNEVEMLIKRVEGLEKKGVGLMEDSDLSLDDELNTINGVITQLRGNRRIEGLISAAKDIEQRTEGKDRENTRLCIEVLQGLNQGVERINESSNRAGNMSGEKSESEIRKELFDEYKSDYEFTENLREKLGSEWQQNGSGQPKRTSSESQGLFSKLRDLF